MSREVFFALLRNGLWRWEEELPKELTEKQTLAILQMAEEQAVLGLVAGAILRNDISMPEDLRYEVIGIKVQIQQGNELLNNGLRLLTALFDEKGVDYVVVKGQAVAARYADMTERQSGDIDYYCDAENFPKSLQAIKDAWGIVQEGNLSGHHIHYDYKGVTYEGHFELTTFYSKKDDAYWQRLLDEDEGTVVMVDGKGVKTLSPTMHTLFVFIHLFHHLLELGIGMRQFCDWAVMLHTYRDEIDQKGLQEHLQVLGLERAYRACGSILVDCLGLPAEEFTYELTDHDRRYVARIMDVIFYRGNMGRYNKRNGFSGWRHNIEATGIKVSHFVKFVALAPNYCCRWIGYEMMKKTLLKTQKVFTTTRFSLD